MARNSRRSPFLDQVRDAIRVKHYSIRTEETYVSWIKRFIHYHGRRHPREMGEREVANFLTHLAVDGEVTASTQNQALNALVFLYRVVLDRPLGEIGSALRAKRPERVPVVLTRDEVRRIFRYLDGIAWLVACLLYGSGLRLMEGVRLRVKDLEFARRAIIVRDGKGAKERVVTLADEAIDPLRRRPACLGAPPQSAGAARLRAAPPLLMTRTFRESPFSSALPTREES